MVTKDWLIKKDEPAFFALQTFLCARKLLPIFLPKPLVSVFTTGCEKFAEQTFLQSKAAGIRRLNMLLAICF